MKIAITGHREIEKALKYKVNNVGEKYNVEAFNEVYNLFSNKIQAICEEKKIALQDLTLISGMARGADEVLAIFAIRNNLPLILSIPGSIKWHKDRGLSKGFRAQAIYYNKILLYPKLTIFEIQKNYNGNNYSLVNIARNQHMIDIADGIISFSRYSSTGTNDGIARAKKANKYLGNI